MFKHITNWIVDCCTEKDGVTACPARIMWMAGNIVYFALSIHNVWQTKTFDYQAFAIGFGAIQAAGSAAVKIKETTEQKVE